jgi:hypothetical protein
MDSLPEFCVGCRWQVSDNKGPSCWVETDESILVSDLCLITKRKRAIILVLERPGRDRRRITNQLQALQVRKGQLVKLGVDPVVDNIVVDVPGAGFESIDVDRNAFYSDNRVDFRVSDNDFLPEDGFKGLVEGATDEEAGLDGVCVEKLADEWANLFWQFKDARHS